MIASWGVAASAILIALSQIPFLLRKGMKKECAVFIILLLVGTILSICLSLGIPLPNPLDWLSKLLKPISVKLELLFK